jgi:hypothetical protein
VQLGAYGIVDKNKQIISDCVFSDDTVHPCCSWEKNLMWQKGLSKKEDSSEDEDSSEEEGRFKETSCLKEKGRNQKNAIRFLWGQCNCRNLGFYLNKGQVSHGYGTKKLQRCEKSDPIFKKYTQQNMKRLLQHINITQDTPVCFFKYDDQKFNNPSLYLNRFLDSNSTLIALAIIMYNYKNNGDAS